MYLYVFIIHVSSEKYCGICKCYDISKSAVCKGVDVDSVDLGPYTGRVQHLFIKNTAVDYIELDPSLYFQLQEVTLEDNPYITCDTILELYAHYKVNTDSNLLLCDKALTLQNTLGTTRPTPETSTIFLDLLKTTLNSTKKSVPTTRGPMTTLQSVRGVQSTTFTTKLYYHPLFPLLVSGTASLISIVCLILVSCTHVRIRSMKMEMQRLERECERRMTVRAGQPLERYTFDEGVTLGECNFSFILKFFTCYMKF